MGMVKVHNIMLPWNIYIMCGASMRHKWKKIDNEGFFEEHDEDEMLYCRPHFSRDNKECIYCGLMKGSCKTMGFWPRMAYYRNKHLLSVDKIPYECIPELKELNQDFLSIDEMTL